MFLIFFGLYDGIEEKMRRVFLSFKMEDKKQVDGVRLLSWSKTHPLDFYDESVRLAYKSENASYIKMNIKQKIERASVTLCLLGKNTHQSEWVAWELETSIYCGNKIVLMGLPNGPDRLILPSSVQGQKWWLWDPGFLAKELD
jgi:hypothetical protein